MTKAAIHHLTQLPGGRVGQARDHGQRGRADLHRHAGHGAARSRIPPSARTCSSASPGSHRVGEPMDVAGAVVFLASPAASLITGAHDADRRRLDRQVAVRRPRARQAGRRRASGGCRSRRVRRRGGARRAAVVAQLIRRTPSASRRRGSSRSASATRPSTCRPATARRARRRGAGGDRAKLGRVERPHACEA